MFDRTYVSTNPTVHHANIKIEEKRAPTDDSVRLLKEMEEKATSQVIKAVTVGNTTFECVVHHLRDNLSYTNNFRAVFKLNGKSLSATVKVPQDQEDVSKIYQELQEEMAKVITAEILGPAFNAMLSENRYFWMK